MVTEEYLASAANSLTYRFDGFPYVMTKIVGTMFHIIPLPKDLAIEALVDLTRRQMLANRLPTCLVFSEASALYFRPESDQTATKAPPYGGILVADKLRPSGELDDSEELLLRSKRLGAFIESKAYTGFMFGDLNKGGRYATIEEQASLSGTTEDGVPKGLALCPTCLCFKGLCLDPSERFRGMIMRVYCRCDNWNRCARCGQPLAQWRLNANYYDPKDNTIWHVPGFSGLSHTCQDVSRGGCNGV